MVKRCGWVLVVLVAGGCVLLGKVDQEQLRGELNTIFGEVRDLYEAKERDLATYREHLEQLEALEEQALEMPKEFMRGILVLRANIYRVTQEEALAVENLRRLLERFPGSPQRMKWERELRKLEYRVGPAGDYELAKHQMELDRIGRRLKELWGKRKQDLSEYSRHMEKLDDLEKEAPRLPEEFLQTLLEYRARTYDATRRAAEARDGYQRLLDTFPQAGQADFWKRRVDYLGGVAKKQAERAARPKLSLAERMQRRKAEQMEDPFPEIPPAGSLGFLEYANGVVDRVMKQISTGIADREAYAEDLRLLNEIYVRADLEDKALRARLLSAEAVVHWKIMRNAEEAVAVLKRLHAELLGTELEALPGQLINAIRAESMPRIGDAFPQFSFTSVDGREISLSDYRGRVVLIDFWATWCGPCLAELPNVKRAYQEFHDKGFEIIGISLDSSQERLHRFIKLEGMDWPQYFDGLGWDNKLAERFSIHSIPATFLVGPDGTIIATDLRGSELERALTKLLDVAD